MTLTKNEAKKLAKSATRILNNEKETNYSGTCSIENAEISYQEMCALLSKCSRWGATLQDNKLFLSGAIYSFTAYLPMNAEQATYYANKLFLESNRDELDEKLGEVMIEACYEIGTSQRISHMIGRLNRMRGVSQEQDSRIDEIIATLEGR